jgi:uncharacterized glyoxalase superfamily protein PhnB
VTQQTQVGTAIIYPFVRYQDARKAMDFLKRAFGFEEIAVYEGDNGTIAHAELALGGAIIMTGSETPKDAPTPRPRAIEQVEQGLYVAVEDIDAHYRRAQAAGAEIVRELADTDYGSREYAAVDTEGFYWSFGTYRPEVTS